MDNEFKDETLRPLLDDEDFARLMEAEYKNSQMHIDELEKRSVWQGIKRHLPVQKPKSHRGRWLVAALALGFLPFVITSKFQDELGIKGKGLEADARLEIQLLHADGRPQKVEEAKAGQTLIFKVSATTASYIALALQTDGGIPEIQFQIDNALTGQDQILAEKGQAFAYDLTQPGRNLKFCLVTAPSRDDLQQKTANLTQHWPRIGANLCQTLTVH